MSAQTKPQQSQKQVCLPKPKTLDQAFRLSLLQGKQIDSYFYIDSLKGKVCIKSDDGDMILFKDSEEYSSPILNTYKSEDEYVVVTENTIYIVSNKIQRKN